MATKQKTAARTKKPKPTAGDAVDAQLTRYRTMRNFDVTAEPSGTTKVDQDSTLPFVIQKHAATRLHYDFRLGWNGVLKSWAVTKGPSYVVADRRLAVQVEDHPMEYGGFEGIIPHGQYGGGTVMVWDQGTWEPHVDVDEGLRKGSLKFSLNGTKMRGNWTLVRMGGKAAQEGKPNWLLIKEHDAFERTQGDAPITEAMPDSVVTGRSLEGIAAASTHVWNSRETAGQGQAWYRKRTHDVPVASQGAKTGAVATKTNAPVDSAPDRSLGKLPTERLPDFLKPQLAQESTSPPAGAAWVHEIKLDGYRIQARKQGDRVQLFTRSGLDWTHRMKMVADAVKQLPVREAILDGEVVVLDDKGLSSFARLQASFEKNEMHPLTYCVFDLLHIDGHDTRNAALGERKALLHSVLPSDESVVRMSEHIAGEGVDVFRSACALHMEGVISKRIDAAYTEGRSNTWRKSKCVHEQEFVVGGWVDLSNGIRGVGSLLLGYYDESGTLIYAGRVGTGFTQKTHQALRYALDALETKMCPFRTINAEGRRGAHWVKPQLVVQVRFATWTSDQQVRQASFLGVREDKTAKEVRREIGAPFAKHTSAPDLKSYLAPAAENGQREKQPHGLKLLKDANNATNASSQEDSGNRRSRSKTASEKTAPEIRLTHPENIVDPESGVTKRELMEYLWSISDEMLPHIAERPLSLVRCPNGSGEQCFYQKHANRLLPKGVGSVMIADKKGSQPEPYITLDSAEALAGLAQISVLEIHPWGSRNSDLEHPDRIVIDLDPDEFLPWTTVCEAALEVRDVLKSAGVESFVKTTGGKGLHVVFPMEPEHNFVFMKAWTHGLVHAMEQARPELYLTKMTKAARTGKIYLDYLRNERGATAVAPYSMRARPGLPVSIPLEWKELHEDTRPRYTVRNFPDWRVRLKQNPWHNLLERKQRLNPAALERFCPSK